MSTTHSTALAQDFLRHERVAVVGASDAKDSFGGTIYKALRNHGYDVTAVNPGCETVAGDPCVPDLQSLPNPVDGVIVMVHRDRAPDVVRECIALDIPRVWLFKGVGSPGAVSDEAVRLCEENGIGVVAGACPLMFLEPVTFPHRVHRGVRRLRGAVTD